jgi:hypothetical protein
MNPDVERNVDADRVCDVVHGMNPMILLPTRKRILRGLRMVLSSA